MQAAERSAGAVSTSSTAQAGILRSPRPAPGLRQGLQCSQHTFHGSLVPSSRPLGSATRRPQRNRAVAPLALVSVEFNPALLLGLGVIGGGLTLYQLRQREAAISRDKDLFISCVCLCSGGILVFQGWRLDPLLLLCQLLTTTVAISYAWETFTARQDADRQQQGGGPPPSADPRQRNVPSQAFRLPDPSARGQASYPEWTSVEDLQRQGQGSYPGSYPDSYADKAGPADGYDQPRWQERQEQQQPAYAGPRTEYAPPPPQGGRGGYSDWQDSRAGGYQGSYEPQDSASRSYAEYWPVEDPAGPPGPQPDSESQGHSQGPPGPSYRPDAASQQQQRESRPREDRAQQNQRDSHRERDAGPRQQAGQNWSSMADMEASDDWDFR